MSAAKRMQALTGSTPTDSAAQAVIALAAAPHLGLLDAEETARAAAVLATVLMAATGAGFVDADLVMMLAERRRWTGVMEELAADVVARIGGPEEFFALLELSTTLNDWIGLEE